MFEVMVAMRVLLFLGPVRSLTDARFASSNDKLAFLAADLPPRPAEPKIRNFMNNPRRDFMVSVPAGMAAH